MKNEKPKLTFRGLFGCGCPKPYPWHIDHVPNCPERRPSGARE